MSYVEREDEWQETSFKLPDFPLSKLLQGLSMKDNPTEF
jgi:hypothetical protein